MYRTINWCFELQCVVAKKKNSGKEKLNEKKEQEEFFFPMSQMVKFMLHFHKI